MKYGGTIAHYYLKKNRKFSKELHGYGHTDMDKRCRHATTSSIYRSCVSTSRQSVHAT